MRPHGLDLGGQYWSGPLLSSWHARGTDPVYCLSCPCAALAARPPGLLLAPRTYRSEHVRTGCRQGSSRLSFQEVPSLTRCFPRQKLVHTHAQSRRQRANKTSVSIPLAAPTSHPGAEEPHRILFCSLARLSSPGPHGECHRGADTGQSPGLIPGELSLKGPESLCPGKLQSAPS